MAIRAGLLDEIVWMAFDTVRMNKLRSFLTVLGIVIGITSIVGMTALIRGFDESLRDSIRELGPRTLFVAKFSGLSFASGKEFIELIRRPNITLDDGRAIEALAPSVEIVDVWLGAMGTEQERIFYKNGRTRPVAILGASENFATVNFIKLEGGRFFTQAEVERRRQVAVLGWGPYQTLFAENRIDAVGKKVRVGANEFTIVGVLGKRPSPGGFNTGADDFVVMPYTTHEKYYGRVREGNVFVPGGVVSAAAFKTAMIAVVPREDATRDQAMREVEGIMRARHRLRLEEPNDFDIVTQDAALKVWDQFSQATFIALVVISSIALMVGGIGVMAIMTISVTERTREIGLRKALGARRVEVLWQFLLEAVFLTSIGGVLGILFGSSIGVAVHYFTGFPISLPWWSFALGMGFSAFVGIFFGIFPAIRASRLDPIEALRYE